MTIYYCLAETTVNGEVMVQENSATYSATTSASATSDISFEDAAKTAIAASNAQALVVGRAEVELLLKQYAYVLSDLAITEMISNSLRTKILQQLRGILLEKIANTVDGKNFILKKNVNIKKGQILQVPDGFTLSIPSKFALNNYGKIQIGGLKMGDVSFDPPNLTYYDLLGNYSNFGTMDVGGGPLDTKATLAFIKDPTVTTTIGVINYGVMNSNSNGKIIFDKVLISNQKNGPTSGVVNNRANSLGVEVKF